MKHYQLAKTKQLGLVMIDLSPRPVDFLWGIEFVSSRSAKDMTSNIPRSGNDAVPFLGGNRQFVSLKVGIFALRRQQMNER